MLKVLQLALGRTEAFKTRSGSRYTHRDTKLMNKMVLGDVFRVRLSSQLEVIIVFKFSFKMLLNPVLNLWLEIRGNLLYFPVKVQAF